MEFEHYRRKFFVINNEKIDFINAAQIAAQKLASANEDWDRDIWHFFADWFNESDFISIKTSGSTGVPKSIQLQKSHMLLSAKKTLDYLGLKENQNALLCLPAAYVAGKMMLVRAIYGGLNIFSIAPKIKLEVPETEIHLAAFIPLQMEELLNRDFDFSPIKNTIIGGAAIPANLENRIAVLPNAFYATYGMTETITHIALQKLNGVHKTEFYTVLPGIKISVDEQNRLQIASPYSDEILQTNDIVHVQSENTFIWLGRTDNVINSGGLKIFPETLEKKLSEFIRDEFFVYGIEDEKLGQKLVLFIQTEKQENSFNSIVEQLKVELGKNEIPKQIILLKQFRYTENNKIQRNETAQQLNSGIRIFLA